MDATGSSGGGSRFLPSGALLPQDEGASIIRPHLGSRWHLTLYILIRSTWRDLHGTGPWHLNETEAVLILYWLDQST